MKISIGQMGGANAIRCYANGSIDPTHIIVSRDEIDRSTHDSLRGYYPTIKEARRAARAYGCTLQPKTRRSVG